MTEQVSLETGPLAVDVLTCWIPRAHDNPSVSWVVLDFINDLLKLIHALPSVIILARLIRGSEMPPLKPIYRTEISNPSVIKTYAIEILPGPISFPDVYALVAQDLSVSVSCDKPQQLLNHASREDPLGGQER